MPSKQIFLGQE